jgi:hypothetical protein
MRNTWAWIASVIVGLCIVGLIVAEREDRWAYWVHRGLIPRQTHVMSHPIDHLMYRSPGR